MTYFSYLIETVCWKQLISESNAIAADDGKKNETKI